MTDLKKSALWYARYGWHVIPLHWPLFDNNGRCCGCSCESYRRSEKYHAWLESKGAGAKFDPAFICRTPGKHPRFAAWEDAATNVVDDVEAWWRRWPLSNVGIAAGKSGLVVLDADSYKAGGLTYEGNTVTSLTGGGGEHLIYQMPDGAHYGNSAGTLPAWLDVRGWGGLFVAPPSVHPSGRLYEWEPGYGPHEMKPATLPAAITAILDAAKEQAQRVEFSAPAPVNLSDYADRLPGLALALLAHDRSKIDFWLIRALVKAGMTPDEILSLWLQYDPTGKFSEKNGHGPAYLAMTIAAARQHCGLPESGGRTIDPHRRSQL